MKNLNQIYRQWAEKRPDSPYLVVDETVLTYGELQEDTSAFASALHALGVKPGDRVALLMDNRLEIAPLYFACFHLGAVAMPISCFDSAAEAAYSINDCEAKLLIVEPEKASSLPDIRSRCPGVELLVLGSEPLGGARAWDDVLEQANEVPPVATVAADAPAVVMYTSGSTGRPKGVTHSPRSLMASVRNRTATFRHNADHSFLTSSKLCHAAALTILLLPLSSCGGTVLAIRRDSAETLLAAIRRNKPTFVTTSPIRLRQMLELSECTRQDFSGIQALFAGGDKVPDSLADLFYEKAGLPLHQGLGMTELGGYMASDPYSSPKPGTIGRPVHETQVRIVDQDMRPLPPGEQGQLAVKTEAMMIGYWNRPEATAETIHDGWFLTGDSGMEDEEGFFSITGRIKNTIIRDGGNITPEEVENAMCRHEAVHKCGVTGIPDGIHGQAVFAFVVPEDGAILDEQTLNDHAQRHLAARRIPQFWAIVDSLPETDMAKLDRKALKELALRKLQTTS